MVQTGRSPVREALLGAALAIAIADGVDAVSTRAVCAAVGVQAPTLYHHFGDRAGLIRAIVDRAFEEYFAQKDVAVPAGSTPEQEVAAGWDRHVAFARAYPGLYPAMYPVSGQQSAHLERSAALLRAGFERLAREGALAPGVTPHLADAALRAALRGVAHAVAAEPSSPDNQQVSATVRDAVIARLIAPTPKDHDTHD
jgi:AcrR family transcriptional regulator